MHATRPANGSLSFFQILSSKQTPSPWENPNSADTDAMKPGDVRPATNGEGNSTKIRETAQKEAERRHNLRYLSTETLVIRPVRGSVMTGVSVEISKGGISAMVNGILRIGDTAEMFPVAGGIALARVHHKLGQLYGFEFMEISLEQLGAIERNAKKSNAARLAARPRDGKQ
jgi:hypothetical protein